jgi:hypothetical protein
MLLTILVDETNIGYVWEGIYAFGNKIKNDKRLCKMVTQSFKEYIIGRNISTDLLKGDFKKDYRKFWDEIFSLDKKSFSPEICRSIKEDYTLYPESHIMVVGMFLERMSFVTEEKSLTRLRDSIYYKFRGIC